MWLSFELPKPLSSRLALWLRRFQCHLTYLPKRACPFTVTFDECCTWICISIHFFTLVWWSFRLPKTCIAVYSYHWWVLYVNVCYYSISIHFSNMVWWSFGLPKACQVIYSYRWWVLYMNVYIRSFFHSGVMVFQVTLNVYSQFRLSWMNDVRECVYPFIFFTLMWLSFRLPKTCIAVYSYHWWMLYLNVYIHKKYSDVIVFPVTQNGYSRLLLPLVSVIPECVYP